MNSFDCYDKANCIGTQFKKRQIPKYTQNFKKISDEFNAYLENLLDKLAFNGR